MVKPSVYPIWNTSEVNAVEPDATRQSTGWVFSGSVPEKPPFEYDNFLKNNVYKWVKYLDEVTDFSTLAEKTTPVAADELILSDSEDSNITKKITYANLASGLTPPSATETTKGIVELATSAEVQAGTDTTRALTPKGYSDATLGINQTWQNVTASRVAGTTYTNSTGKPIQVFYGCLTGVSKTTSFIVDGKTVIIGFGTSSYYDVSTCNIIIPNGSTYSLALPAPSGIPTWLELR